MAQVEARSIWSALLLLGGLAALAPAQAPEHALPRRAGAAIYRAACAQCHGADGRGPASAQVALPVQPPDFADCKVATTEPDQDWLAVASAGGPARAFSERMPAFGRALSDAEIMRVLAHIRTFCRNPRPWPRGELNLPRPLVTEKAFPEDEVVYTASSTLEGDGAVLNELTYERRISPSAQIELLLPFGWRQRTRETPRGPVRGWAGGPGDLAIGAKQALVHSLRRGLIVSLSGEVRLPTGDANDGLGAGATVFESFLTGGAILFENGFLQVQSGVEVPVSERYVRKEGFWRAALGSSFADGRFGRSYTPMVELLGARELTRGARNEWDLLPQLQVTLSKRQHVMGNLGVRVPLDQSGTRRKELLFYLLWDWFDGGLGAGW